MSNRFAAPLPNDPQGTYTLVRTFNAPQPQTVSANLFAPYQFTTIRMASDSIPLEPQPVCEGAWRFFPTDDAAAFSAFLNSVIKAAAPDPNATLAGLFVLTPNTLWNSAMEARLGIRLPDIYIYAGAAMTGAWLTQQSALLKQFPALLEPPTLFDFYRGYHLAGENPFATFELAGKFGWRADKTSLHATDDDVYRADSPMALEHDDRNALYLFDVDFDTQVKSGAARIKIATGWAVELTLTTGNDDYFGILSGVDGVEIGNAITNHITGSNNGVTLTLFEGDELRISIDPNEHPVLAPANFSLYLASRGGITIEAQEGWIASTAAVDDECWIELCSARRIGQTVPALPLTPTDPNTVYNAVPVEGQIRLMPAGQELTPDQWKQLALLRGQVAVPTRGGLTIPLPPLAATAPNEGELTIACGARLGYEQETRRYAPGPFAPSPLESIYQRAADLGIQNDVIEGGTSHLVVQLFTSSLTPRNASVKFAEEEYFPEPDSLWVGGMRFDDCYPSGVVSSEWDGYSMRWQSPYDGGWRRSVISRDGTTYVEVKSDTATAIAMFKRDVSIRYMFGSPEDDRLHFNPQAWLIGTQDLSGAAWSYTCVLEPRTPATGIAPYLPMFYDPRVIEDWIARHVDHYNRNIIGRTGWMLGYWESHPEIAWALFEHVLFRNHGFLIRQINRGEAYFSLVTGLLSDWAIFIVALFAIGAIGTVGIIVVMVLTIALAVLRGLDYQAETGGNGFDVPNDELRDQILKILEKAPRGGRAAQLIDYIQQALEWMAEYLFCSFDRTIETVNYLTMLNGAPQLMAYRWVKRYASRDESDRAADIFTRLTGPRFGCSAYVVEEWQTFAATARQAVFWVTHPRPDLLREPAIVAHAAKMWIDQHQVLESAICGSEASERSKYIGYYYQPAHFVLRALSFFEGYDFLIPQEGAQALHLPPTRQTVGEVLDAYKQWLAAETDSIVNELRAVLDPGAPAAGSPRLDELLAKYPPRGSGSPPASPGAELAADLEKSVEQGLFERLMKIIERAGHLADRELAHPFPSIRDGFGSLERRIEMMLELYSGILRPNGDATDDTRIDALRAWLTAHPNSSGNLAPPGATLEQVLDDDETSEEFSALTNVTHRFEINRDGMPETDWSAGPSGAARVAELTTDFAVKPLSAWIDPF